MSRKERALLVFLIWACVYPSVYLLSSAIRWLGLGWPFWLELLISTAMTVPLISVVASPRVEAMIARARGQSPAELKLDQARDAPGPDPEEALR